MTSLLRSTLVGLALSMTSMWALAAPQISLLITAEKDIVEVDDKGQQITRRVAAELADRVVITTDNPREEAPDEIIAHVRSGMPADADAVVVADRAEAIAHALREARPEDVVLIAGKGHETYQEIMGVRYPFNDADQVRQVLGLEAQS